MKILLVRPEPERETIGLQKVMICEPLELEYIGAYVQQSGHSVIIVDMILEDKPLAYFVRKHKPDIVGITGYIAHVNRIKAYAEEVKGVDRDCPVLVGGVHAEVVPSDFESPFIDYILKANGLKTFGEILSALENGSSRRDIPGIYENHLPCEKETTFNYPHPDRSLTASYRSRYYYMFHNPCALIKTSFGCPYQCTFCFCRQITDGRYFVRELQDILDELKEIPEEEVYIVDDDFLVDRDRLLTFFNLLETQNIKKKYLIYARADFIAANEDVISAFARNGLRAVIVGLESGNEEELTRYNKKSSVKINEAAIRILSRYDVECYGTFILGMDWAQQDFDDLYRWIKKLGIDFINLQPFTPMPGTALYEEYKDDLMIPRSEFEKWDLAHLVLKPGKMSLREYYLNIVKIYYKITLHPATVLKLVRKHGLWQNLKLSVAAGSITWQYLMKALKN